MHSPFHLQVNSQTEVAKSFHTSNNLAKVDWMTIGTTIAAVSRHSSWHWLSYFCISLLKGLHSLMMVSWWWFLTKILPNHMYWNSLRVGLFLIVLIMMMVPSRARTLSSICRVFLERHLSFASVALMRQKGRYAPVYVRFCEMLTNVTCKVAMKAKISSDTITIPWSLLAILTCAYMLTPQARSSKLVVLCVTKVHFVLMLRAMGLSKRR